MNGLVGTGQAFRRIRDEGLDTASQIETTMEGERQMAKTAQKQGAASLAASGAMAGAMLGAAGGPIGMGAGALIGGLAGYFGSSLA